MQPFSGTRYHPAAYEGRRSKKIHSDNDGSNPYDRRIMQRGTLALMRSLGYGVTAVTFLLVAVLSAQAQPAASNRASDINPPALAPHWNGIYAKVFPGCTDHGAFIPSRIVVVPRSGRARTMRYNEATVAHIDATWDNVSPGDDLFTIGKCAQ